MSQTQRKGNKLSERWLDISSECVGEPRRLEYLQAALLAV